MDNQSDMAIINTTDGAVQTGFSEEELSKYPLYTFGMSLLKTQALAFFIIGVPSNLACIITLSKMKPLTSSTFLLMLLAAVDLASLAYQYLFSLLIAELKHRVTEAGCKLYFYFGSLFINYSIWLIVTLTIERLIAVWLPLRVSNLCTVTRAKITSFSILVVLGLFSIPYAISASERQLPSGIWNCGIHPDYGQFFSKWAWVDSTIYLFISWPILFFCNVMIILGLKMSARRKQQLTNSTSQSEEDKRQQQSVTIMLVTVSVACFILLTPNAVFIIYEQNWDYSSNIEAYATYIFLNAFVYTLSFFNQVINFWLYFVSGRRFRTAFLAMITCKKESYIKQSKKSAVTAVSSVSSTSKPKNGLENSGYINDEENVM